LVKPDFSEKHEGAVCGNLAAAGSELATTDNDWALGSHYRERVKTKRASRASRREALPMLQSALT
jgi:hypothetical protein